MCVYSVYIVERNAHICAVLAYEEEKASTVMSRMSAAKSTWNVYMCVYSVYIVERMHNTLQHTATWNVYMYVYSMYIYTHTYIHVYI